MTSGMLARLGLLRARPFAVRSGQHTSIRKSARVVVAWFVVGTIALSGATLVAADIVSPALRDPEYGRRSAALHTRLAENPDRPLVLVVGSSRVGAAICPAAWEEHCLADPGRADPLIFNMGRAGAGPVIQLMTLRRVLAEGVRPAVVLLEYWPPLMNNLHAADFRRIAAESVFLSDLSTLRNHHALSPEFEHAVRQARANPIHALRHVLMLQLDPEWVPWPARSEMVWANLDHWGWLPGLDYPPEGCAERERWLAKWEPIFRPKLRAFAPDADAEQALRDAVALAREHGAKVGFVYLPESGEFRGWYSRKADRAAREHFARLASELSVPRIDARAWLADGCLADGYHLSRTGARELTVKLARKAVLSFPEVFP